MSIPAPGPGSTSLSLEAPSFYLLVATLGVFVVMLLVLRAYYPSRKRGFEGYVDAAGVSLGFLAFAVALVVALAVDYPTGNRTAFALFQTILTGYWLAFAIPIVTVGSSIQARSRGAIRWMFPSIGVSVLMFFAIFGYYFAAAGP